MKLTPKDFFLNVAVMATLYASTFSFIALLFQYIDRVFPKDISGYQDPYASGIAFAIASLIIVFPLFLFFTRLLNRDIRKKPEKRDLGIRRWLIYITLFIAGVAVVVDLIVLLNTFLSGEELTIGFLLKVFVIIVVIGGIFIYYFLDLKRKWEQEERLSKTIGGIVSLVILAGIIAGFFTLGSPQVNRLMRIDVERVHDLQIIQGQVTNFWQQKERLPETLSELEDPLVGFILPTDPETSEPYGYRKLDALTFELCALFDRESLDAGTPLIRPIPAEKGLVMPDSPDANWQHGEGLTCFERTIDPERFPQVRKSI